MVVMAVCVFGFVSYNKLALTLMPDISYPALTVRTEYPGTAPQEIESQLSRRLEQQLGILPNLVNMTSISQAGQSDIVLEFEWGADMNIATQDIREKIDRVRVPQQAESPLILRYDPSLDPILRIGLTGPQPLDELRVIAEDMIKRDLEGEDGVAAVKVKGGLEEEYHVSLDERKLVALNLDIAQVNTRLAQNNVNVPGGDLVEGKTEYTIRTLNEFRSTEEIGLIVVARKGDVDVRLRDVATVARSHKEKEIITRVNGRESIEIEVYKSADANIVTVAHMVRDRLFGTAAMREFVKNLGEKNTKKGEAPKFSKKERGKLGVRIKASRKEQSMTRFMAFQMPEGAELEVLTDQSVFIENSINEVKGNAILGGFISVCIIFLFLRHLGNTAIIGITIPVSIVATFAPMFLSGVSLNIISLGGLALGVGMLVDNSIVVLESIFRCREEGDDFVDGAIRGVSEVGGAVLASTLTTIAVFFPIVFVEGVASQVFGDMSLTVVFSLLASLAVSLYFIPMLASRQFDAETGEGESARFWNLEFLVVSAKELRASLTAYLEAAKKRGLFAKITLRLLFVPVVAVVVVRFLLHFVFQIAGKAVGLLFICVLFLCRFLWLLVQLALKIISPVLGLFDICLAAITQGYRALLDWALQNKAFVVTVSGLAFALSVYFILPKLGSELIPSVNQGEFNLEIRLPVGTPIERTATIAGMVERSVMGSPSVERTSSSIGSDKSVTSGSDEGEHTAKITVKLKGLPSSAKEAELLDMVRGRIADIPDMELDISYPDLFSFNDPIQVVVEGFDLDAMRDLVREVEERMRGIDGIVDVRSTLRPGNPEVQLHYDRDRLAQLDLDLKKVAELVRNKVQGAVPTTFRERERNIDILVRLQEQDRFSVEDLRRLNVNPKGTIPVALETVAEFVIREGPSEIRHIDQQRGVVVSANVDGVDLSEAATLIDESLKSMELPDGFSYYIAGQTEEMERSMNSMAFALGLALFLVYIVMASQFESLLHPFIILFTVPLAIIGVLIALYAGGWSLNILVLIGLIMLAGIVVNNAIVLVDYINRLRRKGHPVEEAVRKACHARLRPILMTTTTTVLGLFPMALGIGEGAEIRVPLAVTVISGLTSSTFLTLVVIPSVYLLLTFEKGEKFSEKSVKA